MNRMVTIYTTMRQSNAKLEFESFMAGYNAALAELDRQKKIRTDRKNKKLIIEDFLWKNSDFAARHQITSRVYHSGVYHADGKQVVTDGRYLLVHNNADYNKDYEGKIIKDGKEIEGNYPAWQKVIPSDDCMTEDNILTVDVVQSISIVSKTKSMDKQYNQVVKIVKDAKTLITFSMAIIKKLEKFLDCYPESVIMRHKDDLANEHCKSWKAVDAKTGDVFVFMPLSNTSKATHSYDIVYNVVTTL